MPTFKVRETVIYEVEADDAEHAEQIIINSEDPNEYFVEVEDREAWESGEIDCGRCNGTAHSSSVACIA